MAYGLAICDTRDLESAICAVLRFALLRNAKRPKRLAKTRSAIGDRKKGGNKNKTNKNKNKKRSK
jgi:hypothetical protein